MLGRLHRGPDAMAAALSTVSGKDGGGTLIAGGVQALDLSGTGAGPWSFAYVLVDGQAGTLRSTIKAASTAPVATDTAFVVAVSPNGQNQNGQNTSANSAPIVLPSDYGVPLDTSKMVAGTTQLTPKFAKITASSSGATEIVPLVAAKKLRVLQWIVTTSAAVNFKWQSHVTPTDKTGLFYSGSAGGGAGGAFCPLGHFETISGEALDINLSGAVPVGGSLVYVEV